ncbi:U8 snoRNA-decapping enzyme isoform X2 [Parasteatoda tepidariorum]|uniref:U8 snoRNA-decapping enzyme isoform X2 n=1 Tax=Parasteatoda tepidariorum TaxID=114398 RepID=UPI00077F87DB|nr:U8 snoRNA-decapping enzyme isoform X2 [Parasteatoda tepidariorum]
MFLIKFAESNYNRIFVMMQMRFDGTLGFHGGIIDEGTDILTGLNRELKEEINLKSTFHVTHEDHMFTHVANSKKFCYHFYAKEVSKEEFQSIEYDTLCADEYGIETFGLVRVPMFVMHDHIRGLPTFLKNQFAGCAKIQLLNFLVLKELCSCDELNVYLNKS